MADLHQPASGRPARPPSVTISDLELYLLPPRDELRERPTPAGEPSLLVRIATDAGVSGWGEAQIGWRSDELSARRDALLAALAGRSIFMVADLAELDALRNPAARCAVEIACWDCIGRVCNQPLCHLWGGVYRTRLPLAVRLPHSGDDRTAKLAHELAEHGFHSLIIPASGRLENDRRRVMTLREAATSRSELRLDGCCAYDAETAAELCEALPPESLEYLLDPLAHADDGQLVSLSRRTNVPLAVSRAIHTPRDVCNAAAAHAVKSVVVDIERTGGLWAARACSNVAEAAGLQTMLRAASPWGIATAALLQLGASTTAIASGNECAYPLAGDDVLTERLELLDGLIAVPQRPGLGIDIDRAKVEALQG